MQEYVSFIDQKYLIIEDIGGVIKSVLPVTMTKEDSLPTYLKINTGSLSITDKVYLSLGAGDKKPSSALD